jgi:endoglucanase
LEELIKNLCEVFGPSGDEDLARELIKKEIEPYCDSLLTDALGNLLAFKGKGGKKIIVDAHMDEIGIIITSIEDEGFLRFAPVGGMRAKDIINQRYRFKNNRVGVVSVEKVEDEGKIDFSKLYLDIGAKNKEEAQSLVKIGEMAVFDRDTLFEGSRIIAKALDNRISCVVLIEALKAIKETPNELIFAFTVQEEVGLRGARTASFQVEADYGIAVDVTDTGDVPKPEVEMPVKLGEGPTIKIMDSAVIAHPKVRDKMIAVAEKNQIPYQREVLTAGGTDTGVILLTRQGIPAGAISIPCRYIHSPNEMADLEDVKRAVKLLTALLEEKWD